MVVWFVLRFEVVLWVVVVDVVIVVVVVVDEVGNGESFGLLLVGLKNMYLKVEVCVVVVEKIVMGVVIVIMVVSVGFVFVLLVEWGLMNRRKRDLDFGEYKCFC